MDESIKLQQDNKIEGKSENKAESKAESKTENKSENQAESKAENRAEKSNVLSELAELTQKYLDRNLTQIVLSNTRDAAQGTKVKVRPVLLKGDLFFQETLYLGTQVFHENLTKAEMSEKIVRYMDKLFKQGTFQNPARETTVLVSKKGRLTVKTRKLRESAGRPDMEGSGMQSDVLSHNRVKQYILRDNTPVDFLVGLGVQTPDGRVTKAKYDKFRQINRYLEFIEDVLEALPNDRTVRIIDFGCGKSYLTFAMYYYLHELQGRDILVTGLDLKTDVIRHCNELAEKLHYDKLHFERGDISTYEGADRVDMVVSLHACDKATDYALEKAVKWGAKVILAVPCCQHELNGQIRCDLLKPIFKYGVIKERMAALFTDNIRANLLEQQGYDVQIMEFISLEHTPKNLLIRAVKRNRTAIKRRADSPDITAVTDFLNAAPTLELLLYEKTDY